MQITSYITEGYVFEPKTLGEAMAICELEPILSSLERPEPQDSDADFEDEGAHYSRDAFHAHSSLANFRMAGREVSLEHVSHDIFPKRIEHPRSLDDFAELGTFAKTSSQARTDINLRSSRIQTEIRNSGARPHPDYDIYICEANMALWKIVMQGKFCVRHMLRRE
jgi:hypothetical protein